MVKQEIEQRPVPVSIDTVKHESQAFLPLTSLTPPPEVGYQFTGLLPTIVPPICSCCVDYRLGPTSPFRTFPASPLIFPNNCRYTYNMFNNVPPSPLRAIPVPVITSTYRWACAEVAFRSSFFIEIARNIFMYHSVKAFYRGIEAWHVHYRNLHW